MLKQLCDGCVEIGKLHAGLPRDAVTSCDSEMKICVKESCKTARV